MYHMANLKKLAPLGAAALAAMAAFQAFDKTALADGAIPKKYKELMAVAVALTTQCPYCLEVHRKAAEAAGATLEELAEVTFVAAALRAGARRYPWRAPRPRPGPRSPARPHPITTSHGAAP